MSGNEQAGGGQEQVAGAVDASAPQENDPPVEESGRPVEKGRAEGEPLGPEDMEVMGSGLRSKASEKVEEIANRLDEIMAGGPTQELEASRHFTHSLRGRRKGWRLIVDVKVAVRREPE